MWINTETHRCTGVTVKLINAQSILILIIDKISTASFRGQTNAVEILLNEGANIENKNKSKQTALHFGTKIINKIIFSIFVS